MTDRPKPSSERQLRELVKEQRSILESDPGDLSAKLVLAEAFRALGKVSDALDCFRDVARAYHRAEQEGPARRVCHSILEISPGEDEFVRMLDQISKSSAPEEEGGPSLMEAAYECAVGEEEGGPSLSSADRSDCSAGGSAEPGPKEGERRQAPVGRMRVSQRRVLRRQGLGDVLVSPEGLEGFGEEVDVPAAGVDEPPAASETPFDSEAHRRTREMVAEGSGSLRSPPEEEGFETGERAEGRRDPAERNKGRRTLAWGLSGVPLEPSESGSDSGEGAKGSPADRRSPPGSSMAEMEEIWERSESGEEEAMGLEEEPSPTDLPSVRGVASDGGARGPVSLSDIPMFSDLPYEAFEILEARAVRREEPAETAVVHEGEPGSSFFVLLSGKVRVEKRTGSNQAMRLAELGPGSFFGEFALLSDRRRHATVITEVPSVMIEISRKTMGELARDHEGVAKTLRHFYRRRLLSTIMRSTPFFSALGPEERSRLRGHLRFRKFSPGDHIVEEGAEGGGFYLILIGEVSVSKRVDGEVRELARMGEGSYFGEMSLLENRPTIATVAAISHTEVVEVDAKDFYRVLGDHPEVWLDVQKEARRRELANHALLTGSSTKVTTSGGGVII
jgi:CRP-like cAMP-binding protein